MEALFPDSASDGGRIATAPRLLALGLLVTLGLQACGQAEAQPDYQVWAADQNGNALYVLDGEGEVLATLDADALGGADRPHMLWAVPGDPYVYSTNTVSNSVTVLDREDGRTLAVVEGIGKAPHAAQPNPRRPDRIYAFNIAPQGAGEDGTPDRGETIAEIVRRNGEEGPAWEVSRHLDLKADPALADSARFPSARPVCGGFSQDGRHLLVTLFDGGLAAVDLEAWRVGRAWGAEEIGRHGCGFAASEDGGELYVTAGDMEHSWLYAFDVSGEEPELVATHDLSEAGQDAHGLALDRERDALWVVHRVSGNVTIHPLATIRNQDHAWEALEGIGQAPDLLAFSPDGSRAFITLRGPNPAPTIPHATVGEAPGVVIVDVERREVVRTVPLGDPEGGDLHGIFIPLADA